MSTWFTSDVHLSHANIIKFCNRPFANADEMNEAIIKKWNETVQPHDHVYILGDVSFANAEATYNLIKRLNGVLILVYGNHDQVIKKNAHIRALFSGGIYDYYERDFINPVTNIKTKFVMCHYPMRVWNKSHHGSIMLFGHCHGSLPDDGSRSWDVGLDNNNLQLLSLEDVFNLMENRKNPSVDHH